MIQEAPKIDFKPGQTYQANVPFWQYEPFGGLLHIVAIIDEPELLGNRYVGSQIVYRCFGKHKQWWHYFIESKTMLEFYIAQVKQYKADEVYCQKVKERKAINQFSKGLNSGI